MRRSNAYVIMFALVLAVVLGGLLSLASVGLGPIQKIAKDKDKKYQILLAVMPDIKKNKNTVSIYEKNIESLVVDINGNSVVENNMGTPITAEEIDMYKEYKKPPENRLFPIFKYMNRDNVKAYILPVYGNGLWDNIWGYLAISSDLNTIKGVVFDHKGETPGLGARITSAGVQSRYMGKKIKNEKGDIVSVIMLKGENNDISKIDEHTIDGMSGATLTAKGVNTMLKDYLGFYKAYFDKVYSENI